MDKMVTRMIELRRGKMDEASCRKALLQTNYFGTMLVQMGYADGLLGGATYSTADTVRPALQLVKAAPGNSIVSSCFVLVKGDEQLFMGDCSININPNVDELVEITMQTANTVKQLGITATYWSAFIFYIRFCQRRERIKSSRSSYPFATYAVRL